jgi:hypothetical protein
MSKNSSLQQKIARERQRRLKKPRPKPVNLEPATAAMTARYVELHPDVLQNMEFGFVEAYRQDPDIDDRSVYSAIRCFLLASRPPDELAAKAFVYLVQMREIRSDVPADVWNDGLRVLLGSLHTHSGLQPGATGYLDFVSNFVR